MAKGSTQKPKYMPYSVDTVVNGQGVLEIYLAEGNGLVEWYENKWAYMYVWGRYFC